MERFWTTEEVAAMLRVNDSTVRRWRLDDVGPRFVKVGSVYRYPDSVLQEWIRLTFQRRAFSQIRPHAQAPLPQTIGLSSYDHRSAPRATGPRFLAVRSVDSSEKAPMP